MGKHVVMSLILICLLFVPAWLGAAPGVDAEMPEQLPLSEEPEVVTPPGGPLDSAVTLRVLVGDTVREMDMGTYLMGVVRAEMPASFSPEALKAQAVAARTYTYYKMEHGGSENHPQADACDNITCCKAYMDAFAAAAGWGENSLAYEEKIRAAVGETDGECVLYEGEPVLAVFHSSSAGMTQAAADVWSGSLPYLQSVPSPESEDTVPNYRSSAAFSAAQLQTLLLESLPEAELSGRASDWFTNVQRNASGAVTNITVGGQSISGNRLRTILGLRSACFTMAFDGDTVSFSVTGYGHGVGMSQYGANALAADGMDYREILAWYYTGTTVDRYESK